MVLTPAFVFWAGGAAAWAWGHNRGFLVIKDLASKLEGFPSVTQVAILVAILLAVGASGIVAQSLTVPLIRFLEGYWPRWLSLPRGWLVKWQSSRLTATDDEYQRLAAKADEGRLAGDEVDRYIELDNRRLQMPEPGRQMPTRLGNVLRIAETRPREKYGLDPVVCWPRLWLVLPKDTKDELAGGRSALDSSAINCLWGALFVVWTPWAWWSAPVGVLVALFAYRRMLAAAGIYGQLLESAYDIHRPLLYTALRFPLPTDVGTERTAGEALTQYLLRGPTESIPLTQVKTGGG
jgi:hypothetical protein